MAPLFVLANIAVFAYKLHLRLKEGDPAFELFCYNYGLIPREVLTGRSLHSLVTHMFLHGSFLHLLFNCVPLYFFGSYLERDIGSAKFTAVYLCSGVLGGLAYLISEGLRSPGAPV
ncbi:TPA: rhomboid family intramembrane serine protease, partial [Candidatus Bathyarchaeota archaeon]|nr:rhomboid family intramembrane serine protease [Candidatus Bathyarchaeota archaeon]